MASKKSALVTGANRGIGREIARQLAALDFSVWLGVRDAERGRKTEEDLRADGLDVRFVQLDVTDDASVRAAVALVEAHSECLDVLVNNVGIAAEFGAQPSNESLADIQKTFDTNFLGTIRVTQAFLPLVRKSPAARVVMVSSGMGSIAITSDMKSPTWGLAAMGYSASKAALNMFTVKLAKELLAEGIKVNAACPGSVATDMTSGGFAAPRTVEQGARIAIRLATLDWMGPTGGFYHDGEGAGIAPYGW